MAIPPDRPTAPLHPRAPIVREEVVTGQVVDPMWLARLEDRIGSLKTLVALLGLVALAGVGLAAWAIVRDKDTEAGPSQSRVSRIDEKVDRLERRLGGASEEADTQALQDGLSGKADTAAVQELQQQVRQLRSSVASARSSQPAPSDGASDDAVAALDGRVDDLAQQVEELGAAVQEIQP